MGTVAVLILALIVALTASACTSSSEEGDVSPSRVTKPLETPSPGKSEDRFNWSVKVKQTDASAAGPPKTSLAVTTYGSGSCPYVVQSVEALPDNWLDIRFSEPTGVCTDDLRRHTDRVLLPRGIDLFAPIYANLNRQGQDTIVEVHVPGRGIQQGNTIS